MKIIVSNEWLKACGHLSLSGVPLEVTEVQQMPRVNELMYHVRLPNGNSWAVWSIRGVTVLTSDKLRALSMMHAAGVAAREQGEPRYYGCHVGMRSTLESDKAAFYRGYDGFEE